MVISLTCNQIGSNTITQLDGGAFRAYTIIQNCGTDAYIDYTHKCIKEGYV